MTTPYTAGKIPLELQPAAGWVGPSQPRLHAPANAGLLFRAAGTARGLFGRKEMPDVLSVFNINRRLFWPWLLFASRLMPFGRLAATDREKIILRTAWNCRSRYEWGQHVDIGLGAGLSDADILRVTRGPGAGIDAREQALLQACDDLFHDKYIADDTWQQLSRDYDEKALIEITVLIGHYEMVAGFLTSAGLQLEAPIEEKLRAFNQRVQGR